MSEKPIIVENKTDPINIKELLEILNNLIKSEKEDYQIEIGYDSLYLHKIILNDDNKVVYFV